MFVKAVGGIDRADSSVQERVKLRKKQTRKEKAEGGVRQQGHGVYWFVGRGRETTW